MAYNIRKISNHNIEALEPLGTAAEKEGFGFVNRTIKEFLSGENDFSGPGEILYGVFKDNACIGICGLNVDPYTISEGIGRLRHLYVKPEARGSGVGELLVSMIIDEATGKFEILRLKSSGKAETFYDKMGFDRTEDKHESHRMVLGKGNNESIVD
ncbi:MAG: GNAT family N-acetyltransferase [Clostridia bacterium]|nr:GNAT family N-acetyltransferase [Clostridia bacterium]